MTFDSILTTEVYEVPDCFKAHDDMDYRYVDVYLGDTVIAHIALGIMGEKCILHGIAEKWSVKSLKAFKTGYFSAVVPGLQELGVKKVMAVHTEDKKWGKFMKMLHFGNPTTFYYVEMEI